MTRIEILRPGTLHWIGDAGRVVLGTVALLVASGAGAQITPMMPNSARVIFYSVDPQHGDLLAVDPDVDTAAVPGTDRGDVVANFGIDAENGDLVSAPATQSFPVGTVGTDRSAEANETIVDAENGDLQNGPTSIANLSAGADRSADVANSTIDAQNGDLLEGAPTSNLDPGNAYPFMVRSTIVDAPNGDVLSGPPRIIVPEPAPSLLLAGSVLLLSRLRRRGR